jgi:hypothetical protein
MSKFKTEMEKRLWEMLYRSQMALADMCRDEMNRNAEEGEWPAGQLWTDCNGSSHSIFCRVARIKAGINHEDYLNILRNNVDAIEASEQIYEAMWDGGPESLNAEAGRIAGKKEDV